MKKIISLLLSLLLFIGLCGCNTPAQDDVLSLNSVYSSSLTQSTNSAASSSTAPQSSSTQSTLPPQSIDYAALPAYSGRPYIVLSNNTPSFSADILSRPAFEQYGALDTLGRCTEALAVCGKEIMPKENEKRGSISSIKPTGWVQAQYDNVSGKNLYNRCHLIGWQLSAENANKCNLITGTRYMNTKGMLPFENMVADYIKETSNHVAYRITPIFIGNNLVASGVQMEAYSIEDNGEGICFNVYVYNVQPDITIDYATGKSTGPKPAASSKPQTSSQTVVVTEPEITTEEANLVWIPSSGKKYHITASCSGMKNPKEVTKDEAESLNYTPCKKCYK